MGTNMNTNINNNKINCPNHLGEENTAVGIAYCKAYTIILMVLQCLVFVLPNCMGHIPFCPFFTIQMVYFKQYSIFSIRAYVPGGINKVPYVCALILLYIYISGMMILGLS